MTAYQSLLLAVAVFLSSMTIDYTNVKYVRAVTEDRAYAAAGWSLAQWTASLLGFLVAVKVTLWLLPAEMLGLWCGCVWSIRGKK